MTALPRSSTEPIRTGTTITLEPPGILSVRLMGQILPEDIVAIADARCQSIQQHGQSLMLLDLSGATSLPAETRKAALNESKRGSSNAMAIYGASYTLTVVVSLLLRGVDALMKLKRPVRFFHSSGEAHAWLLQLHHRMAVHDDRLDAAE